MSIGSIAAPSALRGLSGQQTYELWLDGGSSRWGSLSAPSQQRWEDFARFLEEHAVMHIDPTKIMEKVYGKGGKSKYVWPSSTPIADQIADYEAEVKRLADAGERDITDQQLVDAADLFLRGAVALEEERAQARKDHAQEAEDVHAIDRATMVTGDSWEELAGEVADEYTAKLAGRATPDVAAAVDVLANALKAMLAPKG